jgi:hypothetical protein
MPHIEKYLEQLIAITTNADRKSIKQSQSYKNINDQIETTLHSDNEIARNQLIAQYRYILSSQFVKIMRWRIKYY